MAILKNKIFLILAVLAVIILLFGAVASPASPIKSFIFSLLGRTGVGPKIKLTYWGIFEPKELMLPLINEYQKLHPEIEIDYSPRSFATLAQYKELLLTRLRQGTGPDLLRLHISWVPQFAKDMAPLPSAVMSEKEYSETFYPSAKKNAAVNNNIYAVPLQYDGLALFLNDRLVEEATASAKTETWLEFRDLAAKLTKYDPSGKIVRAGAALGLAGNVAHAADIFGLMLGQSDLEFPRDLDTPAAQDALTFYVNFVRKDGVWSASFTNSIQAFAREEVALMIAPGWRILDIKNLNPALRFSLRSVPQIPSLEGHMQTNIHWATYWVEGVAAKSPNSRAAWDFLKFLSSKESLKKLYTLASSARPYVASYPRTDLAEDLSADPLTQPILAGAPSARSFIITENAGNDPYTEAIRTAIDAAAKGESPATALATAKANIEKLLTVGQAP